MSTCTRLEARQPDNATSRARVLLLVMFVLWFNPTQAQDFNDPIVLSEASGFHRATTDEEMKVIYKENLNLDFQPWNGRKYTVAQLYDLVDTLLKGRPQKYLSLVVLLKGTVTFLPLALRPMPLTMSRMKAVVEGLRNASRKGLTYPNSVYLMNVWDEGRCFPEGDPRYHKSPYCTVPVFSLIKSWDYAAKKSNETDVLLPFFNHVYENLVFFPWEKKHDKALMRAAMQARMLPNSTRLWIIHLQEADPYGKTILDAGISNNLSKRKDIKLADFVPIPDHARWKYLISADGFTASCRLGKLLGTNSVVLKETTPWIEYYYRSLKPNVHYIPFNKDNILQVLKSLQGDPGRCQTVSADAQQFAYTFLSQYGKAMYVKHAIDVYNSLVMDMLNFMDWLQVELEREGHLQGDESGLTLMGLLELMKKYLGR